MKIFSVIKSKVNLKFYEKYPEENHHTQQKDLEKDSNQMYIPPITIDHVTFSTVYISSQQEVSIVEKKLLKQYNKKYLHKFNLQKLSIDVVDQQHFTKITRTTQKNYKYGKDKNYQKYLELTIKMFQNPLHIKHFWSIDFCRLKVMNLSNHNLYSIEGLTFMELPHLVCLELHTNRIINIDCLAKVTFPHLQTLTLYNNKLMKGEKLSRGNLPQLKNIEADTQTSNCKHKIESLQFVFKFQSEHFNKFYAQDENRIMSEKFYQKLAIKCSKYPFQLKNFLTFQQRYPSNLRVQRNNRIWGEIPWTFNFNSSIKD